jgi:uncharacterized spore protein YtfJ
MEETTPATAQHDVPVAFLERLGEKVGAGANATAVFGHPVHQDGVTVIPVARARYGFGGGTGRKSEAEQGAGGGGGAMVAPVGYIELQGGRTRFHRILDPATLLPAILAGGFLTLLAIRSIVNR